MAGAGLGAAFRHLRDLFGSGSVAGLGDGPLLARYAGSGDPMAFEALVARHGPMVLATCRAVLRNEHDVEDAFQATFLVLTRKAGSVRGGDALGGWLHRVAYRASVEASASARKRRRKEAEASAMAPWDAAVSGPGIDPELRPILHEEIDRLPERERLPVVLCDLEGLTYEQAAERLGWTVPALRCRLAKARGRLKGRLTRRGFAAPAVAAALVPAQGVSAAVPAALLRATVLAATGGPASAGALLLTHTMLRGMLMIKLKIAATAALAALAVASAGVLASGGRPERPGPPMRPKGEAKPEVAPQAAPAAPKPGKLIEVKGRVLAPDGKPVAGAVVRATDFELDAKPYPSAKSGPDGRFTISLPEPIGGVVERGYKARYPWLVASAPGFGVGWSERALRSDRPAEQVVTLVEEGPAIEGRIVDLEGRPVAGARVEVARIWFDAGGNFGGWLAKARDGSVNVVGQDLDALALDRLAPMVAKTGPDGRFRLLGIGPDRIADLHVSGPAIATTQVSVMTRDEPEIRARQREMSGPTQFVVHPPRFDIAAAPGRTVEGIARDQDSARPIAGLEIGAGVGDGPFAMFRVEGVKATTDAEGRYRLDGLPRTATYRLFATAGPGLPYTAGVVSTTADAAAVGPVSFNLALKRGVLVRGKVLDRVSGKPVRGAVFFMALADNPHVAATPGYAAYMDLQSARIEGDGGYEIAALPGPGLLAVIDHDSRHRPAGGLGGMKGYDAGMGGFLTSFAPIPASGYHLFVATDFPPGSGSATVDLPLDPGRSATIDVVDGAGRPRGGTKVVGAGGGGRRSIVEDQEAPSIEVLALDPTSPRRVTVTHEGLKLAGSAVVKGDEPGPINLKLQPWGTIIGRVVDDEGRPRKNIGIIGRDQLGGPRPGGGRPDKEGTLPLGKFGMTIRLGDDGRFRFEGLVPGLKYGGYAIESGKGLGDLFENLVLQPGETKDLGDLKVQAPKKGE